MTGSLSMMKAALKGSRKVTKKTILTLEALKKVMKMKRISRASMTLKKIKKLKLINKKMFKRIQTVKRALIQKRKRNKKSKSIGKI